MALEDRSGRSEAIHWHVHTTVEKWNDPATYEAGEPPDEVVEDEGNILLNAGITRLLTLLIGGAAQAYSTGYARLGVGNGSVIPAPADTNLAGPSRLFHGLDVGYPVVTNQTVSFRATYQDGEANYDWNEWGIDVGGGGNGTTNATVVGPLLNRRVPATSLGRKTGGVWTLTTNITIS